MKNVVLTRDKFKQVLQGTNKLKTMCKVLLRLQICDIYVLGAYNTALWNKAKQNKNWNKKGWKVVG